MILAAAVLLQAAAPPSKAILLADYHAMADGRSAAFYGKERCGFHKVGGNWKPDNSAHFRTRLCVRFRSPRRFEGIWHNPIEGSEFKSRLSSDLAGRRPVWLEIDKSTVWPVGTTRPPASDGRYYRISFFGRAARDMSRPYLLMGYGNGNYRAMVIADHIISIRSIGYRLPSNWPPLPKHCCDERQARQLR